VKRGRKIEPELLELEIERLTAKLKHAEEELAQAKAQSPESAFVRRLERAVRDRVGANFVAAEEEGASGRTRKLLRVRADEGGIIIGIIRFVAKGETNGHRDD
jgi:hypothetical protein